MLCPCVRLVRFVWLTNLSDGKSSFKNFQFTVTIFSGRLNAPCSWLYRCSRYKAMHHHRTAPSVNLTGSSEDITSWLTFPGTVIVNDCAVDYRTRGCCLARTFCISSKPPAQLLSQQHLRHVGNDNQQNDGTVPVQRYNSYGFYSCLKWFCMMMMMFFVILLLMYSVSVVVNLQ
jgi:hypothetical protein